MRMAKEEPGPSNAEEEVQITFVMSKDGKKRTIPVWFTVNQGNMELLPMYGLKTKWFAEVEKSGELSLQVKGWKRDATPRITRQTVEVENVKARFSRKYGETQVRKYYPTLDVALEIPLR